MLAGFMRLMSGYRSKERRALPFTRKEDLLLDLTELSQWDQRVRDPLRAWAEPTVFRSSFI